MKLIISSLGMLPLICFSAAADEKVTVAEADLAVVIGDDWSGALTYLNYGEPVKDFTIPAEIDVEAVAGGLKLSFQYPDEPHANQTMISKLGADGTTLSGETIVANTVLASDARQVRTAYPCQDMGRAAACEMIYTFGEDRFEMRKMVTYEGEAEAFRRNVYTFTR